MELVLSSTEEWVWISLLPKMQHIIIFLMNKFNSKNYGDSIAFGMYVVDWPTGLRRWFKVPFAAGTRFRIPPHRKCLLLQFFWWIIVIHGNVSCKAPSIYMVQWLFSLCRWLKHRSLRRRLFVSHLLCLLFQFYIRNKSHARSCMCAGHELVTFAQRSMSLVYGTFIYGDVCSNPTLLRMIFFTIFSWI